MKNHRFFSGKMKDKVVTMKRLEHLEPKTEYILCGRIFVVLIWNMFYWTIKFHRLDAWNWTKMCSKTKEFTSKGKHKLAYLKVLHLLTKFQWMISVSRRSDLASLRVNLMTKNCAWLTSITTQYISSFPAISRVSTSLDSSGEGIVAKGSGFTSVSGVSVPFNSSGEGIVARGSGFMTVRLRDKDGSNHRDYLKHDIFFFCRKNKECAQITLDYSPKQYSAWCLLMGFLVLLVPLCKCSNKSGSCWKTFIWECILSRVYKQGLQHRFINPGSCPTHGH